MRPNEATIPLANGEASEEVERLANKQAALRRVATLVAHDVPSKQPFGAVAREVGTLLGADFSGMLRYEDDASVTTVATWAAAGEHPLVPTRWDTEPGDPATIIAATRETARVDDWTTVPGAMAAFIRSELGVSSSVACPVVVEAGLWGPLAIHSKQSQPLPPDTESRIAQFTDLVGTAIANAESRGEVERLAAEQAALAPVCRGHAGAGASALGISSGPVRHRQLLILGDNRGNERSASTWPGHHMCRSARPSWRSSSISRSTRCPSLASTASSSA